MNNDGIFEIALFPIPGSVSFPQTIVPLHVFEPRYRQMTQDCVSSNRLLGVCHTKSIERFAPSQKKELQTKEDLYKFYQQNLSTFSPEDIFSAGPVEITEKTEDGRYLISIHMLKRYRLLDLVQNSPYKIGRCVEYTDQDEVTLQNAPALALEKRSSIINFIESQVQHLGEAAMAEVKDVKSENSINDLSFKLFRFFRLPEIQMQEILNSRDPIERLDQIFLFTEALKKGK